MLKKISNSDLLVIWRRFVFFSEATESNGGATWWRNPRPEEPRWIGRWRPRRGTRGPRGPHEEETFQWNARLKQLRFNICSFDWNSWWPHGQTTLPFAWIEAAVNDLIHDLKHVCIQIGRNKILFQMFWLKLRGCSLSFSLWGLIIV